MKIIKIRMKKMETYDTNTLYVFTNGLNEKQIAYSIAKGIQNYEVESGDKIQSFFRINIVKNQMNEPLGYAWIYVTNPKLYQLLCGNNLDGTERIEIIEKANFIKPTKPFEEMLEERLKEEDIDPESWASEAAQDDVYLKVKKLYEPEKMERKLPPLIKPVPILLPETNEEVIINLSRGKLSFPKSFFIFNQLKNANYTKIEPWLDRNLLYEIFRPYASNTEDFTYPKIRVINEKNDDNTTVFIEYDPNTTDSLSALNMVKKLYIHRPGEDEPVVLSFNFSKQRN